MVEVVSNLSAFEHTVAPLMSAAVSSRRQAAVEQPTGLEFGVNLTTAEALGLTITPELSNQVTDPYR